MTEKIETDVKDDAVGRSASNDGLEHNGLPPMPECALQNGSLFGGRFNEYWNREQLVSYVTTAVAIEREACAKVCADRAAAASLACDAGAYYEAKECEGAILERSNADVTGLAPGKDDK